MVKKQQFRVVIRVVKKGQFRVVFRMVKRGSLGWSLQKKFFVQRSSVVEQPTCRPKTSIFTGRFQI